MKIGFTGTRYGMTEEQLSRFKKLLACFGADSELHHGDCVGSDAQAHEEALKLGMSVHIHPPVDEEHRAKCVGAAHVYHPDTHFARNRAIVQMANVVIATPYNAVETGGTWYTINYALKRKVDTYIVYPDGSVVFERAYDV